MDFNYFYGSVCVAGASALVNATAVIVIKKKEQSGLNRLIVVDCYANIVTALVQLLAHLPSSSSRLPPVCLVILVLRCVLMYWNRLTPLVIAFFRYIMVCHPIFCQNHGG